MKIVIVPSHNQGQHILKIIEGYKRQTNKPDLLLFVLDRCSDNSSEILDLQIENSDIKIEYIVKNFGESFSAGMTRDFGISYVDDHYPIYEMIIFTDGDCIPSEKLVEKHYENIKQSKKSIVSCGIRYKETIDGEWVDDERSDERWVNEYSFTDRNSRLIISNSLTLDNIFTYSCNFAFNFEAIKLCKEINKKISNSDRVFNSEFDGTWGGEDSFISHCLYRTGNYILMTDKDCYVKHYWHPEEQKYKNKRLLQNQLSKKLESLILSNEIDGPIQTINYSRYINFGSIDYKNDIKNVYCINGIEQNIKLHLDEICNKYSLNQFRNIFDYFLTNNVTKNYCGMCSNRISDSEIILYKQMLGYMKFYLINDEIVFYDDLEKFKKIDGNNSFLEYLR